MSKELIISEELREVQRTTTNEIIPPRTKANTA
jgi:hypothetical protein